MLLDIHVYTTKDNFHEFGPAKKKTKRLHHLSRNPKGIRPIPSLNYLICIVEEL